MQKFTPILLASSSSYRQAILHKVIEKFEVAAPDVDESPENYEPPESLAPRLAKLKASTMVEQFPDYWIIGSDQVAVVGQTRLDKPGNYSVAFRQLSECSGKSVTFFTSVCLIRPGGKEILTETDICRVYFKNLDGDKIKRYLMKEKPYGCAAGLKSEGLGIALIDRIEGNDPNALVGLPLILLGQMMERFGLSLL